MAQDGKKRQEGTSHAYARKSYFIVGFTRAVKEWLNQSIESMAYTFIVATYVEKTRWANAGVVNEMALLLEESTASQGFIEHVSRKKGWSESKVRSEYVAERRPTSEGTKKGKFGEVLHGPC